MKENKMNSSNRDVIGDCFRSGCLTAKDGDSHVKVLGLRKESKLGLRKESKYTWRRADRETGQTRLKDR